MTNEAKSAGGSSTGLWILIAILGIGVLVLGLLVITDDDTSTDQELSQAVAVVQQEMKALGYYTGPVDGVYSPATTEAVKKVQKDCNLTEDGKYGPDTHNCLNDLGGDA